MRAPGSTAVKIKSDPPCLSTFKRRGGVRAPMCNSPAATIEAPRSTALVLSCISQTAIQLTRSGPPLFYHIILPSACPQSPHVILSFLLLARVVPLSLHPPLVACHVSSFHISFPPRGSSVSDAFLHGLSSPLSVITLAPLHFFHVPLIAIAPTISHDRSSSSSVVPDGSMRSLPHLETLSWPNLLQSQEAVNEAVGGG
jgi:hypothetical protein